MSNNKKSLEPYHVSEKDQMYSDDFLSLEKLINLLNGQIRDTKELLIIKASLNDSPLYRSAFEGLKAFIINEGWDELDKLMNEGLDLKFEDLKEKINE